MVAASAKGASLQSPPGTQRVGGVRSQQLGPRHPPKLIGVRCSERLGRHQRESLAASFLHDAAQADRQPRYLGRQPRGGVGWPQIPIQRNESLCTAAPKPYMPNQALRGVSKAIVIVTRAARTQRISGETSRSCVGERKPGIHVISDVCARFNPSTATFFQPRHCCRTSRCLLCVHRKRSLQPTAEHPKTPRVGVAAEADAASGPRLTGGQTDAASSSAIRPIRSILRAPSSGSTGFIDPQVQSHTGHRRAETRFLYAAVPLPLQIVAMCT